MSYRPDFPISSYGQHPHPMDTYNGDHPIHPLPVQPNPTNRPPLYQSHEEYQQQQHNRRPTLNYEPSQLSFNRIQPTLVQEPQPVISDNTPLRLLNSPQYLVYILCT